MSKKIKEPTIDEMNRVIAVYHRGGKIIINKDEHLKGRRAWEVSSTEKHGGKSCTMYRDKGFCNYHEDWNLLMEVAHKIQNKTKTLTIHKNSCALKRSLPYYHGKTTLEAIHKAVYYTIASESFDKMINTPMSNEEWNKEVEKIKPTINKKNHDSRKQSKRPTKS